MPRKLHVQAIFALLPHKCGVPFDLIDSLKLPAVT
jgi:hypothetical protein